MNKLPNTASVSAAVSSSRMIASTVATTKGLGGWQRRTVWLMIRTSVKRMSERGRSVRPSVQSPRMGPEAWKNEDCQVGIEAAKAIVERRVRKREEIRRLSRVFHRRSSLWRAWRRSRWIREYIAVCEVMVLRFGTDKSSGTGQQYQTSEIMRWPPGLQVKWKQLPAMRRYRGMERANVKLRELEDHACTLA